MSDIDTGSAGDDDYDLDDSDDDWTYDPTSPLSAAAQAGYPDSSYPLYPGDPDQMTDDERTVFAPIDDINSTAPPNPAGLQPLLDPYGTLPSSVGPYRTGQLGVPNMTPTTYGTGLLSVPTTALGGADPSAQDYGFGSPQISLSNDGLGGALLSPYQPSPYLSGQLGVPGISPTTYDTGFLTVPTTGLGGVDPSTQGAGFGSPRPSESNAWLAGMLHLDPNTDWLAGQDDASSNGQDLDFHPGQPSATQGAQSFDVAANEPFKLPTLPNVLTDLYPGLFSPLPTPFPGSAQPRPLPAAPWQWPQTIAGPGWDQGTVPPVPQEDRVKEGMDFYQQNGIPRIGAGGLVGGYLKESPELDPAQKQEPTGPARGVGGWELARQGVFKDLTGRDLPFSSYEDQLKFGLYELTKGQYHAAGEALRKATNINDAAAIALRQYERPADQSDTELAQRRALAQQAYDGTIRKTSKLIPPKLPGSPW